MGSMKWAALGVAATIVVASRGLGGHAAFPADDATVESTRYLLDRYHTAPAETANLVRRLTSVCLSERIGTEASADLQRFFGELMVYMVRHIETDRQAFASGFHALAEREGPAIDGSIATLAPAAKAKVAALVGDLAGGPRSLALCVAGKLRTAVPSSVVAASSGT